MIKDPKLRRYWFEFERESGLSSKLPIGCGVTAYDRRDALTLIADLVYRNDEPPPVLRVIEDIDISTLDGGHVIPNMEAPIWRGIWFPMGFMPAFERVAT